MSYAIIRNIKYKKDNLTLAYRHNERRNKNYSNPDIDKEKSNLNYSIKSPKYSYEKEFERLRKEYALKGQIKVVSNIACEYVITSDNEFFNNIGKEETKRYFETAYKFVAEYKNLGEQYIISAKVHMDERTPHMHLVFLPVVHTTDKKGNNIDKLACSEFWKEKDSYRKLQDAFYSYVVSNGFKLERGLQKKETNRNHYSIQEYKSITNFENTKQTLKNIKIDLPETPDIKDIRKFMINRDEKIEEEIIKPKDNLINELYQDNLALHNELSRQARVIDEAEKYQNEKDKIMQNNKELNEKVKQLEKEYETKAENLKYEFEDKLNDAKSDFNNRNRDLRRMFDKQIEKLEKENKHLHKLLDKFKETLGKFIHWICRNFSMNSDETKLVRDFEKETGNYLDPERQLIKEKREKEWDLER